MALAVIVHLILTKILSWKGSPANSGVISEQKMRHNFTACKLVFRRKMHRVSQLPQVDNAELRQTRKTCSESVFLHQPRGPCCHLVNFGAILELRVGPTLSLSIFKARQVFLLFHLLYRRGWKGGGGGGGIRTTQALRAPAQKEKVSPAKKRGGDSRWHHTAATTTFFSTFQAGILVCHIGGDAACLHRGGGKRFGDIVSDFFKHCNFLQKI